MASDKTKFTVGLFVATGISIALLAFIWLGMSGYLEKGQYYAAYFDQSVQGLDVDSPVKYRGVSIGRVDRVGVAPDSKLIQVVLKIESGQKLGSQTVAQLKSVGITGMMFVELDSREEGEPDRSPPLTFPSEYPIVASRPSEISELLQGVDDVLNQIKSLDLEGISDKIKLVMDNINQTIDDANVKGISDNIEASVSRLEELLEDQRWDRIMSSMDDASQSLSGLMEKAETIVSEDEEVLRTAIEDFGLAMKNANRVLEQGSSLLSRTEDAQSQLKRHLLVVAQNFEKASDNLNRLIQLLADQPSQLILGEPPVPREVEP